MTKFAVTAASGKLGAEIVKATIPLVGKDKVVGLARSPANAAHLEVEVRPGDYGSPEQLRSSLQGVDAMLLVPGMAPPDERVVQHRSGSFSWRTTYCLYEYPRCRDRHELLAYRGKQSTN